MTFVFCHMNSIKFDPLLYFLCCILCSMYVVTFSYTLWDRSLKLPNVACNLMVHFLLVSIGQLLMYMTYLTFLFSSFFFFFCGNIFDIFDLIKIASLFWCLWLIYSLMAAHYTDNSNALSGMLCMHYHRLLRGWRHVRFSWLLQVFDNTWMYLLLSSVKPFEQAYFQFFSFGCTGQKL